MSSTEVIANGICVLITYESAKNFFLDVKVQRIILAKMQPGPRFFSQKLCEIGKILK